MKRPINFERIDKTDFEMMGNSFTTDLDWSQDKKERSWVWVFAHDGIFGDYVVLFEMKWEHDCYSMKKCVLGEGNTGDYIFQDGWISNNVIKTKDRFIEHISQLIENEISIGTFKN